MVKKPIFKKGKTTKEDNTQRSPSTSISKLYFLLPVILAGILCYSNTLHGPFVFDDRPNIADAEGIRLDSISLNKLARLGQTIAKTGRPTAQISFALNYYFGGLNTFGYHLTNFSIHLLCAVLVYLFIESTLNLPSLRERYGKYADETALISSLLFVAHPIQTQAVSYIVQRMSSLATLFFLLSLYLYVKARLGENRKACFIGSAAAALLALGSKQNSITLPFYIILYEYYFLRRKKPDKKTWMYTIIGLALVTILAGAIYTGFDFTGWLNRGYQKRSFTPAERMLTQLRVVVFYLGLLIAPLPSRLNLAHDFPLSYSLLSPPATFFCLVIILGLVTGSVYLAQKRPLISFALIMFWGNLVLESSFLPLEMVFEHRLYLPSVGIFLLAGIFLVKAVEKKQAGTKVALFLAITTLLGIMTYQRNKVWQDKIALWEDAAAKSPNKPRATYNLGKAYDDLGMSAEAIVQYRRTIKTDTTFKGAHNNLGKIYLRQGKTEQAKAEFFEEKKHHPENAGVYYNLGKAYRKQGLLEKAVVRYKQALEINPRFRNARNNLGNAYLRQGKPKQAVAEYLREIKHHPGNARAYYNLANAYRIQGLLEKAIVQYKRALKANPKLKGPHNNLGNIYLQQGKLEKAAAEFLEGIRHHADNAFACQNLGNVYIRQGRLEEAAVQYRRALDINPDLKSARRSLEKVYILLDKSG
jgi:tetratricopeptide (TPR) repeat protein